MKQLRESGGSAYVKNVCWLLLNYVNFAKIIYGKNKLTSDYGNVLNYAI